GIVGLLLTLPLLALFFLGNTLVRLPLVPLDFFDFLVPIIPGDLITFVIDIMVDAIIGLGFGDSVDTIAKRIEQAMGYGFILAVGVVVGAVFFATARNFENFLYGAGAVVGAVIGVVFTAISLNNAFFSTDPRFAALWVMGLFVAWGVAFGWLYRDISLLPVKAKKAAPAAAATAGEPAMEIPEAHVERMGRREFLVRVGGATATLTVVGAGLGLLIGEPGEPAPSVAADIEQQTENGLGNALPNANAEVQPAPGMRPEYTPVEQHYRIDIASRPIEIDLATWTLPFTGLIAEDRAFTMAELREMDSLDQYITLQCISNRIAGNLISTTKWTGVPVRDVLAQLDIDEDGKWLRIDGGDGFFEYVSIDMIMEDERIVFAYDWDGQPIPERNGFPLRIYIPERYGMKQPKWITAIEVVAEDERGYWVRRGWSATAIMQTTSIVDTIANQDLFEDEDGNIRVPVGGYAMSSTR
ncbi:MAG: molybdopterin-dependent oxidoreductase, partial [Chloroflexota bacterium]